MSRHADSCPRWREPRDPCSLLVRAEGDGLATVLLLDTPREDGWYMRLKLDDCSLLAPTAGARYEALVTGVMDDRDLAQPVRVKLARVLP